MKSRAVRLWDLWYPWLGAGAAAIASWKTHAHVRVFRDASTSTAVFGGLLTFSALLASVLLALLAIIASLDARPIIQDIRKAHLYPELLHHAFSPLWDFILLAIISIIALLTTAQDREIARRLLATVAFATAAGGMLSTIRFARLLVRVMIDPGGIERPWDPKNTPEAARERGAGDLPLRTGKIEHATST